MTYFVERAAEREATVGRSEAPPTQTTKNAKQTNDRARRFPAADNRRVRSCTAYSVAFFSGVLVSSTLRADLVSEEQAQPVSRLKTFTKAFQHFFQRPGTLAVFAFVVVIAFQDFGFLGCQPAGRTLKASRRWHKVQKRANQPQG